MSLPAAWTDAVAPDPFVVAAGTAVLGALVVFVRREALTAEAEELETRHAVQDGVSVFAER